MDSTPRPVCFTLKMEFLRQNFQLQQHSLLHKGLFWERPIIGILVLRDEREHDMYLLYMGFIQRNCNRDHTGFSHITEWLVGSMWLYEMALAWEWPLPWSRHCGEAAMTFSKGLMHINDCGVKPDALTLGIVAQLVCKVNTGKYGRYVHFSCQYDFYNWREIR